MHFFFSLKCAEMKELKFEELDVVQKGGRSEF